MISVLLIGTMGLIAFYPIEASAFAGPGQALSGLLSGADTSVTSPGNYSTEARNAFIAGGFNVHFPVNDFQLINVEPPSFNAGCSGISMFFGGFSFISGAQFSSLVQNIMQAAIGYAVQLAIQTLCPACEAVLQVLQKAAQMANSLGNNTCRLAKEGVNALAGAMGVSTGTSSAVVSDSAAISTGAPAKCAKDTASTANGSGFLSSLNSGVCQYSAEAVGGIESILNTIPSGAGQKAAANKAKNMLGNLTFQALNKMGIDNASTVQILMSLVGTVIGGETSSGGQEPATDVPSISPQLGGSALKPLLYLYLCGYPNGTTWPTDLTNIPGAAAVCNSLTGGQGPAQFQNYQLYYCAGSDTSLNIQVNGAKLEQCTLSSQGGAGVGMAPIGEVVNGTASGDTQGPWTSAPQNGFIVDVATVLNTAVADVQSGTALPNEAIQLIQTVPFPLYQVIDLAAVYPNVASSLVANASVVIALMLSERMILQVSSALQQTTTSEARLVGVQNILRSISAIRSAQAAVTQKELVANNLELQMMAEVRQVNRLVQDQVMQEGILGNQAYASNLMSNVTLATPGSKA